MRVDHDDGSVRRAGTLVGPALGAARAGDADAFGVLYGAFNRRVAAFARSRGVTDPQGLVNDVFLGVFRGLATFSGDEADLEAWIFRIARNKIADEHRRRARRPQLADLPVPELVHGDDVETDVLAVLGEQWVQDQLATLTPEQRDVLLLRVVADLTVDQTAAVLGKRPGAVKALQRRALRRLSRELCLEAVPL